VWRKLRGTSSGVPPAGGPRFHGSDRDAGAIRMSRANAERAGIAALTEFREHAVSDLVPPEGPPGLVIVNPPYGGRIGEKQSLFPLYRALGQTLLARFAGWRVGVITNEAALAAATGLPFAPPGPPVTHGGLRVTLFQTGALSA
jgi:putative N6-adenine-specific DNA methylase